MSECLNCGKAVDALYCTWGCFEDDENAKENVEEALENE